MSIWVARVRCERADDVWAMALPREVCETLRIEGMIWVVLGRILCGLRVIQVFCAADDKIRSDAVEMEDVVRTRRKDREW
jgi:hypothetical protein